MTAWKRKKLALENLRDQLAAAALQGITAHLTGPERKGMETTAEAHGRIAYAYADAALRNRKPK